MDIDILVGLTMIHVIISNNWGKHAANIIRKREILCQTVFVYANLLQFLLLLELCTKLVRTKVAGCNDNYFMIKRGCDPTHSGSTEIKPT